LILDRFRWEKDGWKLVGAAQGFVKVKILVGKKLEKRKVRKKGCDGNKRLRHHKSRKKKRGVSYCGGGEKQEGGRIPILEKGPGKGRSGFTVRSGGLKGHGVRLGERHKKKKREALKEQDAQVEVGVQEKADS